MTGERFVRFGSLFSVSRAPRIAEMRSPNHEGQFPFQFVKRAPEEGRYERR
jgi:hypothetical protein